MQFMVDCAVILNHSVILGVSQRNLRVQKYRGSAFDENGSPLVIGNSGFDIAIARMLGRVDAKVTNERVTSGVKRLDTMLGGGYYRGVLITGSPGPAKTTLSGAFGEAACRRVWPRRPQQRRSTRKRTILGQRSRGASRQSLEHQ